jgi:subfamily B ATP-binding cassette protein MsbA
VSQTVPLDPRAVDVYRRLLRYTMEHWGMFLLAIVGMVVYAITETSFAALIKPLLDRSFVDRDPDYIKLMPLAILAVFLVRGIASFVSTYFMAGVGRQVIKRLRREVFDHFLRLPTARGHAYRIKRIGLKKIRLFLLVVRHRLSPF